MQQIGSGRSLQVGQRGPKMISPSLIILFALHSLNRLDMCALRCLGFLHSMGLIQQADLIEPIGSEFLHSISLRVEGSSVLKLMGTNSTRIGKGLAASETSEPNLEINTLEPSRDCNHSVVSMESTSYKMCPWEVFLAEMNSVSSGGVVSRLCISLRAMLAFSIKMFSSRCLNEAVGSLCGGIILIVFFFFFESNYSASKHEASYCTLLAKVYRRAPCGLTPSPWMRECPNRPGRKVPRWSASFLPRVLDAPS